MSDHDYDFLVLGGGSGGLACARRAASYGARVAVVEPGPLGGTCVNVGCVPKKVMWNAARIADAFADAADYGFDLDGWGHDWARLVGRRQDYIARLNAIYARNLDNDGVTLIRGRARFGAPGAVLVDGRELRAAHILIATGGHPSRPDVPGADLGIDSDGFFGLTEMPRRVCIAGSGYIAMELAGLLHALGAEVTVAIRRERVLRDFDVLLGEALMERMRADGIRFLTGTRVTRLEKATNGLRAHFSVAHEAATFDTVLWAIGREPNTAELALERVGVETDTRGYVVTDTYQNTGAEGIYALGDVAGRFELTPVAIAAGRRLADRIFGGQADRRLDYENIPSVIFSHPPIGSVGLSERDARARFGGDVHVFESRFNDLYYGVMDRKVQTHMKLIAVGAEQRIVGCHVIGMGADEMLQGFAVALRMGATKRDFDDTVAIHPTAAEEMVTMT